MMDENHAGMKKMYSIWKVKSYNMSKSAIIKNVEYYELDKKIELLETYDECYNDRIDPKKLYKFFGDCDNYKKTIKEFITLLVNFLNNSYDLQISNDDVMYTENEGKKGSYHYVIPLLNAKIPKLKEIHKNFSNAHKDEFTYMGQNNKTKNVIDTTIYSVHWFRCPNQSKEGKVDTRHKIKKGTMKDFILDYIEESSINIDNKIYFKTESENEVKNKKRQEIDFKKDKKTDSTNECNLEINNKKEKRKKKTKEKIKTEKEQKEKLMITIMQKMEYPLLYKFFDKCFKQERFDDYGYWTNVGMAIKNCFGKEGFGLFEYFSNKGTEPDPKEKLVEKYDSFSSSNIDIEKQITIRTIYYYAKEDNKRKYIKIIKKYSLFKKFNLSSVMISKYIKILRPNDYLWKGNQIYCFNGRFWEKNDLILRKYIGNELYEFLEDVLTTCFSKGDLKHSLKKMERALDKLRQITFMKEIIERTREDFTNENVEFDEKWFLFGFNNKLLNLNTLEFREYEKNDFITITTGYDWEEPAEEEVRTINNLIKTIHPDKNIRQLYLEILSTGFEGKCLEKFIIFNGCGGNGKGLINDILIKAYGGYGIISNNAILFEKNRTGSNPEKNNLHKMRFVVFREPPSNSKIENSVMKELTGGGSFSARGHYESNTVKKLNCTVILECNKKPYFTEEPQEANIRRIIDLYFSRIFTDKIERVDEKNNIFLANSEYKTEEFQKKHTKALLKILLQYYKNYRTRNSTFNIPKSITERTTEYVKMSSNILNWVYDEYEKTTSETDIVKLCDMFNNFRSSEYYNNLPKIEKIKYCKKNFVDEISHNLFLKKYYYLRKKIKGINYNTILINHKIKNDNDNDNDIYNQNVLV